MVVGHNVMTSRVVTTILESYNAFSSRRSREEPRLTARSEGTDSSLVAGCLQVKNDLECSKLIYVYFVL